MSGTAVADYNRLMTRITNALKTIDTLVRLEPPRSSSSEPTATSDHSQAAQTPESHETPETRQAYMHFFRVQLPEIVTTLYDCAQQLSSFPFEELDRGYTRLMQAALVEALGAVKERYRVFRRRCRAIGIFAEMRWLNRHAGVSGASERVVSG